MTLLEGWARDGLTDAQIASNIGINTATLYDWKKRYSELNNALKKGKEVVDYAVENALLKKALGGDVTAMIFWLKNRRPDKWREKREEAYHVQENHIAQYLNQLKEVVTDEH